jgi:hypothetical protein
MVMMRRRYDLRDADDGDKCVDDIDDDDDVTNDLAITVIIIIRQ